jgi:hypothetical protein
MSIKEGASSAMNFEKRKENAAMRKLDFNKL